MDDKEVIDVLSKLINKDLLSIKEREALAAAIGILSWTVLSQSRIKSLKAKKEKKLKW